MALEKKESMIVITIMDQGRKYDFNRLKTVRDKGHLKESRPRSGMGVYIIRQLVDAVMYNYLPDIKSNELKLIKNI